MSDTEKPTEAGDIELCKLLFGEDWQECVTQYGQNKLYERYVMGEIPNLKAMERAQEQTLAGDD